MENGYEMIYSFLTSSYLCVVVVCDRIHKYLELIIIDELSIILTFRTATAEVVKEIYYRWITCIHSYQEEKWVKRNRIDMLTS